MESGILYHLETASLPVFDDAVAFACVVQTAENQVDTEKRQSKEMVFKILHIVQHNTEIKDVGCMTGLTKVVVE